jgi:hypothetical protein
LCLATAHLRAKLHRAGSSPIIFVACVRDFPNHLAYILFYAAMQHVAQRTSRCSLATNLKSVSRSAVASAPHVKPREQRVYPRWSALQARPATRTGKPASDLHPLCREAGLQENFGACARTHAACSKRWQPALPTPPRAAPSPCSQLLCSLLCCCLLLLLYSLFVCIASPLIARTATRSLPGTNICILRES